MIDDVDKNILGRFKFMLYMTTRNILSNFASKTHFYASKSKAAQYTLRRIA